MAVISTHNSSELAPVATADILVAHLLLTCATPTSGKRSCELPLGARATRGTNGAQCWSSRAKREREPPRLGRELVRQAEVRKDPGDHEGGHLLHKAALQGKYLKPLGHVASLLRIPAICSVRRLAVCPGSNVAMDGLCGEPRDYVSAAPPARIRRHRERGVLGQHCGDRVDVAPLPRIHVGLHNLADALVSQPAQGGLLALLREPFVDSLASALQGAVRRRHGRLEEFGDLTS